MEFQAITAALIGGLSVTAGGVGRVERTLVGALIVGMLANYQTIRGVSPTYQDAVLGGILLLAVVTDRLIRGRADVSAGSRPRPLPRRRGSSPA